MKVIGSLLDAKDGNAFNLMGHFSALAKRQGFDSKEIQSVLDEAMSGEYDHLVRTLMDNMSSEDE